MSKRTNIFATKGDLEPGLRSLESRLSLQYVLTGLFESPRIEVKQSIFEVVNLGVSLKGAEVWQDDYLVAGAGTKIEVRAVPQRKGGVRYPVDQLANPETIVFKPSGLFEDRCLISGYIGTASDDPKSNSLYRAFARHITKGFTKIHSYYVGPEALQLLNRGVRLTADVRSPEEYDLRPPAYK